jgi:thiamine pyrophosphokinase
MRELLAIVRSHVVDVCAASRWTLDRPTVMALGGRLPEPAWFARLVRENEADVWAVDSGVAACRAAGVAPSAIVGDGDSAAGDDWSWALESGAREYRYDRAKDLTDFQLALGLWEPRGALVITGCFGGRFDHLTSVADTLAMAEKDGKESEKNFPRCMIDHAEGIFFIRPSGGMEEVLLRFKKRVNAVSLLSMSEVCAGVSISGVRWELDDAVLTRARPWAVSNELAEECDGAVRVSCAEGVLAVYWCGAEGLP